LVNHFCPHEFETEKIVNHAKRTQRFVEVVSSCLESRMVFLLHNKFWWPYYWVTGQEDLCDKVVFIIEAFNLLDVTLEGCNPLPRALRTHPQVILALVNGTLVFQ